jgi:beta-mannosidase
MTGTIHTRLLDFSGNVLLDQKKDIQIRAQSSAIYLAFDRAELLAKTDSRRAFAVFDLEVSGKRVSRNLQFFEVTHDLQLPTAPEVKTTLTKTGEDYTLSLSSAALARSVYLSFGDLDVHVSDNYFDLLPGESASVTLKSSAALDQLKQSLKVVTLTDAFR